MLCKEKLQSNIDVMVSELQLTSGSVQNIEKFLGPLNGTVHVIHNIILATFKTEN